MIRAVLIFSLTLTSALSAQSTKEEVCESMASVVKAIQQARLDRVKERDVQKTILSQPQPWPENYNNAIVHMIPWVYRQRMRDVRNKDLAAAWDEVCQANWQELADLFE